MPKRTKPPMKKGIAVKLPPNEEEEIPKKPAGKVKPKSTKKPFGKKPTTGKKPKSSY